MQPCPQRPPVPLLPTELGLSRPTDELTALAEPGLFSLTKGSDVILSPALTQTVFIFSLEGGGCVSATWL